MEEEPIVVAIKRIEAALSRVEAASRKAADLAGRHHRLKASVSRSLEDLDRLIGSRPA